MLLEINFTPYIPTTLFGLLGLISGYIFFYFRNKNNTRLKEIQSANPKDRIRAIEMSLNDLGVSIDTSNLDSNQKLIIIKDILRAKANRYLTLTIALLVIALLATFLIWNNSNHNKIPNQNETDTTKKSPNDNDITSNDPIRELPKPPPDIEKVDGYYPTLTDYETLKMAEEPGSGCEIKEGYDTLVLIRVVEENPKDSTQGYYIMQNKNGIRDPYYLDEWNLSSSEHSWVSTIMLPGRKLRVATVVCGSGGITNLIYVEPLKR